MKVTYKASGPNDTGVYFLIAFMMFCIISWVVHVVWIIGKLSSDVGATVGQMVLGGIGAFMPPIGIVHGVMIMLGYGS